jgi:heme A synthase
MDSNGHNIQYPSPARVGVAFAHRVWALAVVGVALALLALLKDSAADPLIRRPAAAVLALLVAQVALGASVIWSGRHPEVATAHQAVGAAVLACAALLAIRLHRLTAVAPAGDRVANLRHAALDRSAGAAAVALGGAQP